MSTNPIPSIRAKIHNVFNDETRSTRAIASVTVGDAFAIHGISVVRGENGDFVRMPSRSYKENGETKHTDIAHAVTAEARQALNDAVLAAYAQAQTQAETRSMTMGQ